MKCVGQRCRLVPEVVDCTVKGLVCHVDSVGLNPLGTWEPAEILKPRVVGGKQIASP